MRGEHLLPLALLSSKFGGAPSARLGIIDQVIAVDFDEAALLCLHRFEQQQQTNALFMAARLNGAFMWGNGESSSGATDGGDSQQRAAEFFGPSVEYV